jgi:exonuclease SbcD
MTAMKILHTADWHLNDRLGRIDRTEDLRRAVERVAHHCRDREVDVLLVAGDLFSELARPDALRETIRHWQEVFTGFLTGGGTILTITGNHDNENFCKTLQHAMTLAAPTANAPGERVQSGRLYLAAEPTFLRLRDRTHTFDVQFVLMPFPTASRYLKGEEGRRYTTPNEKNQFLTYAFNQAHVDIRNHPKFDATIPTVLAAHVTMHGSHIGPSLFRIQETEDIVIHGEGLHAQYEYVALGHIHKPQFVGHTHVRYSGSIERLDLGEQHNVPGAVLFEIAATGRVGEPEVLPLPGTPVYEVTLLDPYTDLERLKSQGEDTANDLVNLHIHYTPGEHNLEEILAEAEKVYPRWYARDWVQTNALGETLTLGEADRSKSLREIVHGYADTELQNHDEVEKQELLTLLGQIIDECEAGA